MSDDPESETIECKVCGRETPRRVVGEEVSFRGKGLFDGCDTVDEMVDRLDERADKLREYRDEGFTVAHNQDDYIDLRRSVEESSTQ